MRYTSCASPIIVSSWRLIMVSSAHLQVHVAQKLGTSFVWLLNRFPEVLRATVRATRLFKRLIAPRMASQLPRGLPKKDLSEMLELLLKSWMPPEEVERYKQASRAVSSCSWTRKAWRIA